MEQILAKEISFSYRVLNKKHNSLKGLFRDLLKGRVHLEDYLAIDKLSFKITKGKTVAIIGRNGAGKSTLLKLIAGVMSPTNGDLLVKGKIAPMIELGAGFNSELTGKENILFYSSLIGRDLKQVKPRITSIGEWAGLEDHLDFQLRTYSTGMIARLAFAVATDSMPDLLIVDEVLSVGDSEFTKKSKNRMTEITRSGCTVIMVSHDLDTVLEMADEVIWLEKGKIKMLGSPTEVIKAYRAFEL